MRIHDWVPVRLAYPPPEAGEPGPVVAHALHREHEVGPIERGDDQLGVWQTQHLEDLGARGRRRAAGESDRRRALQPIAVLAEAAVDRAKFVAPFHDAVSFIYRQERHRLRGAHQSRHERPQPLRRAVQQLEAAMQRGVEYDPSLLRP